MAMSDTSLAPNLVPDTNAAPTPRLTGDLVAYLVALVLIVALAVNTVLFGLPGLAMTALALVPVCYGLLILLSLGRH